MTAGKVLGVGLIAFLAYYFLKLKSTVENLSYRIAGAGLSFQGITPILRLDVKITNPDPTAFTIKSIVGDLYTNGKLVGTVEQVTPTVIAGNSQTIYKLYIRLSIIGIASDIVSIFNGNGIQQQLEFDGTVYIDNLTAPLQLNYTLG